MSEQLFPREDTLNPFEIRLAAGVRRLRWSALMAGAVALVCMALALIAALFSPSLFDSLRSVLLFRYAGSADTALAIVTLSLLANLSLFLVVAAGVIAREVWSIPALIGIGLLNTAALVALGLTPALLMIALLGWSSAGLFRDRQSFRVNPVALKELRGRMRGARAFLVLSVYLGLMSLFAILIYLLVKGASAGGLSSAAGEIGRMLFAGVVGIELLLIVFIAPAFTAGAISGERERQTYDLLQTTLLSPSSFVFGKLESALGYIMLLLLAGIPLQSIAFLFGGVSELELFMALLLLTVTSILVGTIGIYYSAVLERTLAASSRAYGVIITALVVLPTIISGTLDIIRRILLNNLGASPVLEAIVVYLQLICTAINPLTSMLTTQQVLIERGTLAFWQYTLTSNGNFIPMPSAWILTVILYLAASAVLLALAVRRARRSTEEL
ncbi:hypothetical protein FBR02_13110 [Anaerolineae bacterium CFX9]|jgi:ABC-type transport system involved in multi-copper enzyme maturation permease subunit|nr:hypothetical protein [Anaerolineae bacterium CFX9]